MSKEQELREQISKLNAEDDQLRRIAAHYQIENTKLRKENEQLRGLQVYSLRTMNSMRKTIEAVYTGCGQLPDIAEIQERAKALGIETEDKLSDA